MTEHRQVVADLRDTLVMHMEHWDQTWKGEAELRAEGDQEVENRLKACFVSKLEVTEAQLSQVSSSVGSLARLQVELGSEAKIRQDADGKLQSFLKDFRAHVVNEVEEMWTRHTQLSVGVEGIRSLMSQIVELVELRTGGPSITIEGALASPRIVGPDELEVARGLAPCFGHSRSSSANTSSANSAASAAPEAASVVDMADKELAADQSEDSMLPIVNVGHLKAVAVAMPAVDCEPA